MERIRGVLAHIGIICSLAVLAVQVLDWYNPFMDFAGQSRWVLYLLCASCLVSGILNIWKSNKEGILWRKK